MQTFPLPPLFHQTTDVGPSNLVTLKEQNPGSIRIWQWKNVKNAAKLRQGIIKTVMQTSQIRVPDACFLDARMIIDVFQIQLACTLALQHQEQGKMKTRSLYAEVLYCLSPHTNITDTLKTFGVRTDSTDLLVVAFKGYPQTTSEQFDDDSFKQRVSECIEGEPCAMELVPDLVEIQATFKCAQSDVLTDVLTDVVSSLTLKGV